MNVQESTLVVSHSPNKTNIIKVVEIGEPAFFGPSSILINLYSK